MFDLGSTIVAKSIPLDPSRGGWYSGYVICD